MLCTRIINRDLFETDDETGETSHLHFVTGDYVLKNGVRLALISYGTNRKLMKTFRKQSSIWKLSL